MVKIRSICFVGFISISFMVNLVGYKLVLMFKVIIGVELID